MDTTRETGTTTAPSGRPYAVVGATGQQGGATARALLAHGAAVRALTRDPASAGAQELAAAGAEVVQADVSDRASLDRALDGVAGLFAMTTFAGPRGTDGEVEDGRTIADAALAAGVPHVVYSSVGGAERGTGVPHFESKRAVEEHMESIGLSATFVRPTFFMDNFSASGPSEEDGVLVLRSPLSPGVPLQMVATTDIGRVAAAALLAPASVPGGAVEIAGDELTPEAIAEAFGQAAGLPARFEPLPTSVLGDEDLKAMFTWFTTVPSYLADREATRRLDPEVMTLADWLASGSR